jgi:hypothetical protein
LIAQGFRAINRWPAKGLSLSVAQRTQMLPEEANFFFIAFGKQW